MDVIRQRLGQDPRGLGAAANHRALRGRGLVAAILLFSVVTDGKLAAADILGKIVDATTNPAIALIEGDAVPAKGDTAEIFFTLPGSDVEVSVANGKVAAVRAKSVEITIEKASGTVEKDQLVRIKAGGKSQATDTREAQNAGGNPLRGDWTGTHHSGGAKISFSFKDDNTLLWVIESPTTAESVAAKYRVDTTVTPHVVEMWDFDSGEMKGHTLYGLFELQSDGRLKFDVGETRDRGFDERETIFLSRATAPIVRPPTVTAPSPTPEASLSAPAPPTPTPDARPLDEQKMALGDQYSEAKDFDAAIEAYSEAIKVNPKSAWAYKGRGFAFFHKEDYENALADFNKALILPVDPNYKQYLEEPIKVAKEFIERHNSQREPQKKSTPPKAKKPK